MLAPCPDRSSDRRVPVERIAPYAGVVELVDTPDLGSGAFGCASSSLAVGIFLLKINKINKLQSSRFPFLFQNLHFIASIVAH